MTPSLPRGAQFVFGYGSLVTAAPHPPSRDIDARGFIADLVGFRRTWGVAMDNRRDLPGYKYYTDLAGRRPDVSVAFLDIWPADPESVVNGVCRPVDESDLARLDRRERNYDRVDVSARVCARGGHGGAERERVSIAGARVWAYVGSPAGRQRLAAGRAAGAAVIDAGYLCEVRRGFAALGEAELRACRPSLDPDGLPVVALRRHPLTDG